MFGCCLEFSELVIAPCGRRFKVCTNCDNGINDCTEGQCDHPKNDMDCPFGPECDAGREPCCDGCASGLGPCHGPGWHLVCYTHNYEEKS